MAQPAAPPRLDCFGDPLPPGTLARLGTLRFHRCDRAACSPDGKPIATVNSDMLSLRDAKTDARIRQLALEGVRWPAALVFAHDGTKLAVIGQLGGPAQVWDLKSFKKVVDVELEGGSGGGDWSHCAAFSSDDKTLVAGTSSRICVTCPAQQVSGLQYGHEDEADPPGGRHR